jgi:hypothetical protein
LTIPEYCTQNDGNCPICSLVSYGRDCQNISLRGRFFSLAQLASKITGGNLAEMAKLLNDMGADGIDELDPKPETTVPRTVVIDLAALRAGDVVGRRAAESLTDTITP